MSTDESPIDVAAIRPGQLVSGQYAKGGTFTDVPVRAHLYYPPALVLDLVSGFFSVRLPDGHLCPDIAEITNVRDPRPAWADDPTAILIDGAGDLYSFREDGYWYSNSKRAFTPAWMVERSADFTLFGHRVAEDES